MLWQADRVSTTPGVIRRGGDGMAGRLSNVSNSLWRVGVQAGISRV